MIIWVIVAAIFVAYAVASTLDTWISDVGVKSGIAVEGNDWLNWFAGSNKPSTKAYVLYSIGEAAVLSSFAVFGAATANPYCAIISCGPWIAMIIKHIQGYRAWRKLGIKL